MNYQQQVEHYKAVRMRIANVHPVQKLRLPSVKCDRPFSDPRREILHSCAREFNVTVDDILGNSRMRCAQLARWNAAIFLYERGTMSIARIGKYLNKDHTTIVHIIKKHKKGLAQGEAK